MKFDQLDVKVEGAASCYLIRSSLSEYLSSLPHDYASYDVQRAIVNNSYLDKLVLTVLNKRHIPSITLVLDGNDNLAGSDISNFKILDGLQRTHRLKVINDTRNLFLEKIVPQLQGESDFQLKRKYRDELVAIGSSSYILIELKRMYEAQGRGALESCFSENYQWFEVWSNLGPREQVQKMLLLNAGHKPVNIRHQLELLFNNIFSMLAEVKAGHVKVSREKDVSSSSHSKERGVGEFHFSHLISSLISYVEKKPVSTNSNLIEKIQSDEDRYYELVDVFSYEFLEGFVAALFEIDMEASRVFGAEGVQWMGRDTSLTAVFAALGECSKSPADFLDKCSLLARNFRLVDVPGYEVARKNLDLAKVNIGAVSKRIIFKAVVRLIQSDFSKQVNWLSAFEGEEL
ncbi:hypothetical protein [Pseudomonas ovata]|uniref:hypothetical protein n=1 Tax=Pseudomonas ovata TaxID=1839709 RepID=UPI000D686947|nr:hypothetical protein [Pseudomonas ovata]